MLGEGQAGEDRVCRKWLRDIPTVGSGGGAGRAPKASGWLFSPDIPP